MTHLRIPVWWIERCLKSEESAPGSNVVMCCGRPEMIQIKDSPMTFNPVWALLGHLVEKYQLAISTPQRAMWGLKHAWTNTALKLLLTDPYLNCWLFFPTPVYTLANMYRIHNFTPRKKNDSTFNMPYIYISENYRVRYNVESQGAFWMPKDLRMNYLYVFRSNKVLSWLYLLKAAHLF